MPLTGHLAAFKGSTKTILIFVHLSFCPLSNSNHNVLKILLSGEFITVRRWWQILFFKTALKQSREKLSRSVMLYYDDFAINKSDHYCKINKVAVATLPDRRKCGRLVFKKARDLRKKAERILFSKRCLVQIVLNCLYGFPYHLFCLLSIFYLKTHGLKIAALCFKRRCPHDVLVTVS